MKIYIAGKITGDKKYRAKFREAAKALEALGHVVLNPAILPAGRGERDYMRITLAMLEAAQQRRNPQENRPHSMQRTL